MTIYAVIDTNVLVSALLSKHDNAATVQVLDKLFLKCFVPLLSNEILQEYAAVLRRKKFKFSESIVASLLEAIEIYGEFVTPTPLHLSLPNMKDLPFYEVVMEKHDDNAYLVTGNLKHFPHEPCVVSVHEFLELLNQR